MKNRIISLLLVISLCLCLTPCVSAARTPAWSEAFYQEIFNVRSYESRLISSNGATFALRDLNADGTPELIVGDGHTAGTYGHGYVLGFGNGNVTCLDFVDSYGGEFGAHLAQGYPGFCTCIWAREYSGDDMLFHYYYHTLSGGKLTTTEVARSAGSAYSRVCSDTALYQAVMQSYLSNSPMLELHTSAEIRKMGWDAFIGEYLSPVAGFYDVSPADWYAADVEYCAAHSLMNGTGDGIFSPKGTATRAQIVTILYRLSGEPKAGTSGFSDVPDGTWYSDAVAWAKQNAIVNGTGNGRFSPNNAVTREQLATILYNYAVSRGVNTAKKARIESFSDFDAISGYAVEPLRWANAAGIVGGNNRNQLNPRSHATRAELAAILHRFCENVL